MPHAIVIMGVSGSGKSALGAALAARLGCRFIEGDTLHPPANIGKMGAGIALTDQDRQPFLDNVAAALSAHSAQGVVVSCSALKRRYRDQLRRAVPALWFLHPVVDRGTLAARLAHRPDHYMPAALLDSQLATLEPLASDEVGVEINGAAPADTQLAAALDALDARIYGVPP
jgi:carbohydrate kinase (thermoresistant glucokinase family)